MEDKLLVGLVHRKMNNGRRERPIGFRFEFGGDTVTVISQDAADMASLATARQLTDRIVILLSESGKLSVKQIAEALEEGQGTVRATLANLRKQERVTRLERGMWGAITKADEEFE